MPSVNLKSMHCGTIVVFDTGEQMYQIVNTLLYFNLYTL